MSIEASGGQVDYRLPRRYQAKSDPRAGVVTITDTETGRAATIPMEIYGPVTNALAMLLPDGNGPVPVIAPEDPVPAAQPLAAPTPPEPSARQATEPSPASQAGPSGSTTRTSAKPAKAPPAESPAGDPGACPPWLEASDDRIEHEGFVLEKSSDPVWGYAIIVNGRRQGFIAAEAERRWVMQDLQTPARFDVSVHRNIIGATARLMASVLARIASEI